MGETKLHIDFEKGSVAETLFIPLYVKARETGLKNPVVNDPKAVEILGKVELDLSRFNGGAITSHGILVRTGILDKAVKSFLEKYPDGTVINLGAGLDTRITRIDNGRVHWYDLDLPDVIDLRRQFFMENDRVRFISKLLLDCSWADDVETNDSTHVLIVAEGLLMYFNENELKDIFRLLAQRFPNADMYFDVVHSYFVGKGISTNFIWGINSPSDIEKLDPSVRLIEHWSTGDFHKSRQGLFLRVMGVLQPSVRNRSQVLHINFGRG